jgi:hypothetical protein
MDSSRNGPSVSPGAKAVDPDPAICAILRHEPCPWDGEGGEEVSSRFVRTARLHGVLPLLDMEFRERNDLAGWPKEIQLACLKAALVHATHEMAQRAEVGRVIEALAAHGIRPLVLKGSALACSHYADPSLRPRIDTDLLIPKAGREAAYRTLGRLGYSMGRAVAGDFIPYQSSWSRTDSATIVHRLDVHWHINNYQVLAKVFGYEELAARSVPLPGLGPSARSLDPVDALLLACIHRAGHATETVHFEDIARLGSDRLIWLYDIHLLASRMSEVQFDAFARLAVARKVKAICLDALKRSQECFGTAVPPRLLQALSRAGAAEPSASLLTSGAAGRMVGDFLALDRWRDRAQWLRELAFPDAEYMRWKYQDAVLTWLPVLYLRRGVSAVARLAGGRKDER